MHPGFAQDDNLEKVANSRSFGRARSLRSSARPQDDNLKRGYSKSNTALRFLIAAVFAMLLLVTSAFGQGSKMRSAYDQIEEADKDHPRERVRWMMRGREAPKCESAARLRLRAQQQKLALRAQHAEAARVAGAPSRQAPQSAEWVNLGPAPLATWPGQSYGNVTGRVTAVAVDPTDSTGNTVYVGAASGGVWKSTNAAASDPATVRWTPLTDQQGTLATGAIAIKSDGSVVLVGTGEPNNALSNYYGLGFLRSTDEGTTWSAISSANNGTYPLAGLGVSRIAWGASGLANTVVAGLEITAEGFEEGNYTLVAPPGFYTSSDNGQSWNYNAPQDGGVVTANDGATDVVFNAAAGAYFGAISFRGVYKSSDGTNWTRLSTQPGAINLSSCPVNSDNPGCPMYRGQLAVVPGRNEMYIWFADFYDNDGGVYKSTDGGASWRQIPDNGINNCGDFFGCGAAMAFYDLGLAAIPDGSATDLYAGAVNLFKCKVVGGANTCSTLDNNVPNDWINLTHVYGCNPIANPAHVHPDEHGLDYKVAGGKAIMYFATDGGVYRALDGYMGLDSGTCTTPNQFDNLDTTTLGSLTQFVSFSLHPTDQNTILGGTQDNGSPASTNATGNSPAWNQANYGDGGYNAINPTNPSQWFTEFSLPIYISVCNTAPNCDPTTFQPVVTGSGNLAGDEGAFYTPYILDPQNAGEMLVGTCRVWRGSTSGGSFTALSDTFDGSVTCPGQEGGQIDLVNGLAAGGPQSGGFSNVVYATTQGTGPNSSPPSNGEVWVTTGAGTNLMSNVTGNINPKNYTISSVAIDNFDATGKTAYVGIMGFLGSGTHIWKTADAGGSWTAFGSNANGLPDAPVNALLVDSSTYPSQIYAGTDVGVFVSSSNSPVWTEVGPVLGQAGYLPNVAVMTLQLFNKGGIKKLRAGTYGRGIWEYDLVATPNFTNEVSNPVQTIFPSQNAVFNGTLTAVNGYDSAIDMSCTSGGTEPPPTCILNPTEIPAPGSGNYAVTANGAIGDYSFNAHAVGNDPNRITHDGALTLHVVDYAVGTPNPNAITVPDGFSGQTSFQVTAAGSFSQSVALICPRGLPSGATCSFAPNPANPTSASPVSVTLTVTAAGNTPTGTKTVTIEGDTTNPTGARTTTFQLTITPPPEFTWTNTGSTSHTVLAGQTSQQYTFNATPQNAQTFTGPVTFSCGFSPADPTLSNGSCVFNPPSIAAGAGATNVTMTITTTGPNNGTGPSEPRLGHLTHPRRDSALLPLALPIIVIVGIAGCRLSRHALVAILCGCLALFVLTVACGGGGGGASGGGGGGNIGPTPISVSVTPSSANVPLGGTQQFNAVVSGSGGSAVTWSLSGAGANGSTISDSGLLTVPTSGTTPINFTVVATSQADATKSGSAAVTIPAVGVSVTPATPVNMYANEANNSWPQSATQQQFTASVSNAGNRSVTWSVPGGNANGTIDQNGLYTSPAVVPNPAGVSVTATSQADGTKAQSSGSFNILRPTSVGTFTVTVTATEGSVSHPQQVMLAVQ